MSLVDTTLTIVSNMILRIVLHARSSVVPFNSKLSYNGMFDGVFNAVIVMSFKSAPSCNGIVNSMVNVQA